MAKQISKELKQSLKFVKKAYEDNDTEVINKIENIAGIPIQFTGKLLEAYDKIGETPLETPELELNKDDFDNHQDFIFDLGDKVAKLTEVDESEYSIQEFSSFIIKCYKKVNDFFYDNGDAKTTPLTENAKLPTFSSLKAIRKIMDDKQARLIALGEYDEDTGDIEEYVEAIKIINEESDKKLLTLTYKITGIKAKGLTEWEKSLLMTNIVVHSTNSMSSGFGRSL